MAVKQNDPVQQARRVLQRFADKGNFTANEVKLALRAELTGWQDDAFTALVERAYKKASALYFQGDSESRQPTLFDITGGLKLGGGRIVDRRFATLDHLEEWLLIDDVNREAVDRANQRKHEEVDALRPYLGNGVTLPEAVAAYQAAQKKRA